MPQRKRRSQAKASPASPQADAAMASDGGGGGELLFAALAAETIFEVLNYAGPQGVCRLSSTCKQLQGMVASAEDLWAQLVREMATISPEHSHLIFHALSNSASNHAVYTEVSVPLGVLRLASTKHTPRRRRVVQKMDVQASADGCKLRGPPNAFMGMSVSEFTFDLDHKPRALGLEPLPADRRTRWMAHNVCAGSGNLFGLGICGDHAPPSKAAIVWLSAYEGVRCLGKKLSDAAAQGWGALYPGSPTPDWNACYIGDRGRSSWDPDRGIGLLYDPFAGTISLYHPRIGRTFTVMHSKLKGSSGVRWRVMAVANIPVLGCSLHRLSGGEDGQRAPPARLQFGEEEEEEEKEESEEEDDEEEQDDHDDDEVDEVDIEESEEEEGY